VECEHPRISVFVRQDRVMTEGNDLEILDPRTETSTFIINSRGV